MKKKNYFILLIVILLAILLCGTILYLYIRSNDFGGELPDPTLEYQGLRNGWYVYKVTSMGGVPKYAPLDYGVEIDGVGDYRIFSNDAVLGYKNHSYTNPQYHYYGNVTYYDADNNNNFSVGDEINLKSTQIGGPVHKGMDLEIIANGYLFRTKIPYSATPEATNNNTNIIPIATALIFIVIAICIVILYYKRKKRKEQMPRSP